jgi:hypothetical protein
MQVWRLPGREHVRQTRSGRKGRVVGRVKNFIGTLSNSKQAAAAAAHHGLPWTR